MTSYEKKNKQFKRETEEILSSYLLEMKEENEKFLHMLEKSDDNRNDKLDNELQKEQKQLKSEKQTEPPLKEYEPPTPEDKVPYNQSREAQALLLHKQGYSIADIAKKLSKGQTEIELMLKFRQERS
jgi:DNA-binding NarL/FixJ family response regulator